MEVGNTPMQGFWTWIQLPWIHSALGRLVPLLQDLMKVSVFSRCTYSSLSGAAPLTPLFSCLSNGKMLHLLSCSKNAHLLSCLGRISTSAHMDSPHLFSELHNISFSLMDLITLYEHFNSFHISAIRQILFVPFYIRASLVRKASRICYCFCPCMFSRALPSQLCLRCPSLSFHTYSPHMKRRQLNSLS